MLSLLRIPWISRGWTPAPELAQTNAHQVSDAIHHLILCRPLLLLPPIPPARVQPRWIQGIRSGDGVGEDQETTA